MIIKKYIPEKYNLASIDIVSIIQNVCGIIPVKLQGRIVEFEATATQATQIKTDFLTQVEEVQDFTL